MDRIALINRVKSKIDELSPDDAELVGVVLDDGKPVDDIIDSLLDESALEVLFKAPIHRLSVVVSTNLAVKDEQRSYTGTIELPSDFLRLVEFKMAEWSRPVTVLYDQGSDMALRQSNKWLRAKVNKPVAVLSQRTKVSGDAQSVKHVIEYYSVVTSHNIDRFYYIKKDVAENIPDILVDALCWICASKVLTITQNVAGAKTAIDNAVDLLN